MNQQGGLINCKKCGSLFIKGARDICDNCFKAELEVVEKIKTFINKKGQEKTTIEEIVNELGIDKNELEDLIEKGRLFSVMPKLIIKCRFCGIEIEDEQKSSFVCTKCLNKFSPKGDLAKINAIKEEQQKEISERRIRRTYSETDGSKSRCGFIQNYDF